MEPDIFWGRVKPLIKKNGLTQASLAEKCGIPFGTFQGWIAKSVLPSVTDGCKIAKALNTTAEYLVTGEESNPFKHELDSLKSELKKLSDKYLESK